MASEAARARRMNNMLAGIEAKLDALNGQPLTAEVLEGETQPSNADLLSAVNALAEAVAALSVKLDDVKALVEAKKSKA